MKLKFAPFLSSSNALSDGWACWSVEACLVECCLVGLLECCLQRRFLDACLSATLPSVLGVFEVRRFHCIIIEQHSMDQLSISESTGLTGVLCISANMFIGCRGMCLSMAAAFFAKLRARERERERVRTCR